MRISVDHRTTYRLPAHRSRLTQLLRLTPDDNDDQTVAAWTIHLDRDARMRTGRDGFGNRTMMLYVDGPLDAIELSASGEVLTHATDGMVRGSVEPLPPALFLRPTALTAADAPIAEFAADAVGSGGAIERLHRLNNALHQQFAVVASSAARAAAEAFLDDRISAGDAAHLFCAAAHTLGVPARYVSGFSTAHGDEPALHAWAEAHVAGLGWVSFDPSTGASADDRYVRVAVALDAVGASPVAGPGLEAATSEAGAASEQ